MRLFHGDSAAATTSRPLRKRWPLERLTTSYTSWMVQRARDAWLGLTPPARAAVERALEGTGCEALLAYAPRHRVVRRPFKLFLAG